MDTAQDAAAFKGWVRVDEVRGTTRWESTDALIPFHAVQSVVLVETAPQNPGMFFILVKTLDGGRYSVGANLSKGDGERLLLKILHALRD